MIKVNRLQMRLPHGFEHRGGSISRQVGELLAQTEHGAEMSLDRISLAPITITGLHSDLQVAEAIVQQIKISMENL